MAQVFPAANGRSTAAASKGADRAQGLPAASAYDALCSEEPRGDMSILRVARRMRAEWRCNRYSRLKPE